MLEATELFNTEVQKESTRCMQVLVVTELVVSGTQYTSIYVRGLNAVLDVTRQEKQKNA